MIFERIRLRNFKCYGDIDVALDTGVTVIHGPNGSGKSTLLEACFFALYGASALDTTLEEVVTIGETEMAVDLGFTHGGESFRLEREVRVRNGGARTTRCVLETPSGPVEGARDVRERVVELLRMDATAFVNCAYVRQGEVNKLIEASPADRQDMLDELLQLGRLEEYRERASDARVGVKRVLEDRQAVLGELDEQIDAKESRELHGRRNEILSELDDLTAERDRIETNRERARETLDRAEGILAEHEQRREDLERLEADIESLREQIRETERERETLAERIEECRQELTAARGRREELVDTLSGSSTGGPERAGEPDVKASDETATGPGLDPSSDDLRGAAEAALTSVREEIEDLTDRIRALSVEKQEHDSECEQHRNRATELDEKAATKRERADELEAEVSEARERLAQRRAELEGLTEEIEETRSTLAGSPVAVGEAGLYREALAGDLADLRERRGELEGELEAARGRVAEAERLREAGRCPECGQPVDGSPHVEALAERRDRVTALEDRLETLDGRAERLAAELERAEQLVDTEATLERLERERENLRQVLEERAEAVAEKATRVEGLRDEAAEHADEAEQKREAAATAETRAAECQEEIAARNREKAALTARRADTEELVTVLDELEDLTGRRERLREQRAERAERNEERRERLTEKRDRRDELREAVDESRIAQAREKRAEAEAYLEEADQTLQELAERRDELQATLGGVENELEELEGLRERRDRLAGTVERLESLYGEAETLEAMYGDLRAQLRQQNVERLEQMLNETFGLVYRNDSYARLELDGEYQLRVFQKDGQALDPEQLSGGERALFNLSLRCAIYRLLAEGIEGTAPMPPLILDEPTVFLDSGHVSQLVALIESMYELGVDQILVVSHDEALLGAADDLVTVRTDPTTNRSTVERGRAQLPAD